VADGADAIIGPDDVRPLCQIEQVVESRETRARHGAKVGPVGGILSECGEDARGERWLAQFWTTRSTIHAFGSARRRSASYIMALSLS